LIEQFESFIDDVLDKNPQFERVLTSMLISPEEKIALLDRVVSGSAHRILLNFLKVAAGQGRLNCLRSIWRSLSHEYNALLGRVEVELRAALPVDPPLLSEITQSLSAAFAKTPVITFVHDPSLIGGLVVRVGDTVYDGSVATQLNRARHAMIEKSVELIETKRERLLQSARGMATESE
jgi:F-type H+-transporting ATPase subunit delta